jgi:hypothetical protein
MVNVKEYDLKLRSNVMHYGWGWGLFSTLIFMI